MSNFPFNAERWKHYKLCQKRYIQIGDCDPAYPVLKYLLQHTHPNNIEKAYWLAFLYSTCYAAPTAWVMLKTMPPYGAISENELENWWIKNKQRLLFTTDRSKVKNFDKFVPMVLSYKKLLGDHQQQKMEELKGITPEETYNNVYKYFGQIYYVGRFSLFLITEVINVLTNYPMIPTGLDLTEAESCRNGLCYAIGADSWVHFHGAKGKGWAGLSNDQYSYLYGMLNKLIVESKNGCPELDINYWNVETTLCAYKKYYWNTRYLGFYLDRQLAGLIEMAKRFPELGEDWKLFFEARRNLFDPNYLGELHNWTNIRKSKMGLPLESELNI